MIHTNIAHVTVKRFVLMFAANSAFTAMVGFCLRAAEMFTLGTKIFRKLSLAGCTVVRVFVYLLFNVANRAFEVGGMPGFGSCIGTLN